MSTWIQARPNREHFIMSWSILLFSNLARILCLSQQSLLLRIIILWSSLIVEVNRFAGYLLLWCVDPRRVLLRFETSRPIDSSLGGYTWWLELLGQETISIPSNCRGSWPKSTFLKCPHLMLAGSSFIYALSLRSLLLPHADTFTRIPFIEEILLPCAFHFFQRLLLAEFNLPYYLLHHGNISPWSTRVSAVLGMLKPKLASECIRSPWRDVCAHEPSMVRFCFHSQGLRGRVLPDHHHWKHAFANMHGLWGQIVFLNLPEVTLVIFVRIGKGLSILSLAIHECCCLRGL